MKITEFLIHNDSIILKRGWDKKPQKEIIKDVDLISRISNYVFFFFVEKNKYVIFNPRMPGVMSSEDTKSFHISVHRKGYNPIKKDVHVEPDFTYSKEFLDFLELLDSF